MLTQEQIEKRGAANKLISRCADQFLESIATPHKVSAKYSAAIIKKYDAVINIIRTNSLATIHLKKVLESLLLLALHRFTNDASYLHSYLTHIKEFFTNNNLYLEEYELNKPYDSYYLLHCNQSTLIMINALNLCKKENNFDISDLLNIRTAIDTYIKQQAVFPFSPLSILAKSLSLNLHYPYSLLIEKTGNDFVSACALFKPLLNEDEVISHIENIINAFNNPETEHSLHMQSLYFAAILFRSNMAYYHSLIRPEAIDTFKASYRHAIKILQNAAFQNFLERTQHPKYNQHPHIINETTTSNLIFVILASEIIVFFNTVKHHIDNELVRLDASTIGLQSNNPEIFNLFELKFSLLQATLNVNKKNLMAKITTDFVDYFDEASLIKEIEFLKIESLIAKRTHFILQKQQSMKEITSRFLEFFQKWHLLLSDKPSERNDNHSAIIEEAEALSTLLSEISITKHLVIVLKGISHYLSYKLSGSPLRIDAIVSESNLLKNAMDDYIGNPVYSTEYDSLYMLYLSILLEVINIRQDSRTHLENTIKMSIDALLERAKNQINPSIALAHFLKLKLHYPYFQDVVNTSQQVTNDYISIKKAYSQYEKEYTKAKKWVSDELSSHREAVYISCFYYLLTIQHFNINAHLNSSKVGNYIYNNIMKCVTIFHQDEFWFFLKNAENLIKEKNHLLIRDITLGTHLYKELMIAMTYFMTHALLALNQQENKLKTEEISQLNENSLINALEHTHQKINLLAFITRYLDMPFALLLASEMSFAGNDNPILKTIQQIQHSCAADLIESKKLKIEIEQHQCEKAAARLANATTKKATPLLSNTSLVTATPSKKPDTVLASDNSPINAIIQSMNEANILYDKLGNFSHRSSSLHSKEVVTLTDTIRSQYKKCLQMIAEQLKFKSPHNGQLKQMQVKISEKLGSLPHFSEYIELSQEIKHILERLVQHRYKAYVVGGYTRDTILGLKPNDVDIVTDAPMSTIMDIFKNEGRIIGHRHPIFSLQNNSRLPIQIKPLTSKARPTQTETLTIDGTLLVFHLTHNLKDDALGRDFTINSIYCDHHGELISGITTGREDLQKRELKFIGDPKDQIRNCPTLILRAIRFIREYCLTLDSTLEEIIQLSAPMLSHVPTNALTIELLKMLVRSNTADLVPIMQRFQLPQHIYTLLDTLKNQKMSSTATTHCGFFYACNTSSHTQIDQNIVKNAH